MDFHSLRDEERELLLRALQREAEHFWNKGTSQSMLEWADTLRLSQRITNATVITVVTRNDR